MRRAALETATRSGARSRVGAGAAVLTPKGAVFRPKQLEQVTPAEQALSTGVPTTCLDAQSHDRVLSPARLSVHPASRVAPFWRAFRRARPALAHPGRLPRRTVPGVPPARSRAVFGALRAIGVVCFSAAGIQRARRLLVLLARLSGVLRAALFRRRVPRPRRVSVATRCFATRRRPPHLVAC